MVECRDIPLVGRSGFNNGRVNAMNEESERAEAVERKLALVQRFFADTGPTYDFMVNAATFGIDRRWKRQIVAALPENPARVLDLACGTGILTFAIARRYPRCRIVGVELRDEYLRIARDKARDLGLDNVEFVLGSGRGLRRAGGNFRRRRIVLSREIRRSAAAYAQHQGVAQGWRAGAHA